VTALALLPIDLLRVSRDLAWAEIAAMPGLQARLGPRINPEKTIDWSANALALDSLARMQLATAAATWCNAYDAGFEDLFLAKRSTADWAVVMQRARASGAAHFTFSSSGSTGTRKHIRHREDVLADEARAWADVLGPPSSGTTPKICRVIVLAPTHHIYGFIWGVLLPLALGVEVVDADIASLPEFRSGDLVIAVPDQWAYLADSSRVWPAGVQGISSTASLPDAVHRKLVQHPAVGNTAPLARLLQIYGSSETAGLAWRADPAAPYTLAPGRTRNAHDEIELLLPSGKRAVMPVQDELKWSSDNQFELLRRTDQSVQVGGHNVSPDWVARQLQLHPRVKQAAVRLDTLAAAPRLKAFVVLRSPDETEHQQEIEAWALNTLPWYAALASVTYGDALPQNAMGKSSDWPAGDPLGRSA
jgi:long-chain acyl-CoA synthetase